MKSQDIPKNCRELKKAVIESTTIILGAVGVVVVPRVPWAFLQLLCESNSEGTMIIIRAGSVICHSNGAMVGLGTVQMVILSHSYSWSRCYDSHS